MSGLLGVIAGTIIVERSNLLKNHVVKSFDNQYGRALVLFNGRIALVPRHGNDPQHHILPHQINHRANLQVLKDLDVSEIVGINSTGSLKKELYPGMIVVPDDFLTLTATPSLHDEGAHHITPSLNENIRQKIIQAAKNGGINVQEKGVYWQTTGPRLETKAEIRMMANYADIVGMTMANEAVIAVELGLPYASACSIDNFGNGLLETPLSIEKILSGALTNADLMIKLLENYLQS